MRSIKYILGLSAVFCIAFLLGAASQSSSSAQAQQNDVSGEFPLLIEAVNYVNEVYVKDIPEQSALEYAVIRGYLSELGDANTFFIEPAVAANESDTLAGRYGGIGVDLQRNETGDVVLYPYADSPAEAAGIVGGDILLSINGEALDVTTPIDQMRRSLRGEITDGSGVSIVIRSANGEEQEFFILFDEVLVPSVIWRSLVEAPELGYIKIVRFTSRTPEEFRTAVADLRAENIQGIVLDLRGNSGGLLKESIDIADEFLDNGVISIEQRVSGENLKEATPGGVILDLPVVVLINNRTASASEIVAGALQDQNRAMLIGQLTFGKGSIQSIFALSDSSSIHVTVALWYTPNGTALDGVGLTPDITMIPDEAGRDVELGEAIRYLREEIGE